MPFVLFVPGLPPSVSSVLVESLDLYPTLSSAAGLGMPPDVDGVDLTPLLRLGHELPPSSVLASSPAPAAPANHSEVDLSLASDHHLERLLLQKNVAFSEYPRCMHNLTTPWDKLDSCVSTPKEEFHLMGYSVRVDG